MYICVDNYNLTIKTITTMARIEISLNEYNNLKNTIEQNNQIILQQSKKINELEEYGNHLHNELNDFINGTAFYDRVFKWDKIIGDLKMALEKKIN